ncbi:hypothetical protein N7520_002644 [Penicillium odoratum]|uniref:uncharacterized protein n=1 Tax=Penicillium odoratum TaxID=1167516 RepID=UPI002069346E|nr:uncharacterized protein N7520_002644 [Penicillium odoratum]KAJ5772115.1 hypothetical protein N7520_002644 [Penicillium odoratum]UPX44689.1 hypothetical protein FAC6B23_23 [Penicillium fuscum]UXX61846.1 hypothetical protein FAC4N16_19 [Penicillium fuscum]
MFLRNVFQLAALAALLQSAIAAPILGRSEGISEIDTLEESNYGARKRGNEVSEIDTLEESNYGARKRGNEVSEIDTLEESNYGARKRDAPWYADYGVESKHDH